MSSALPLSVLLIDDDDVALEAVQRSLRKHNVYYPVYTACDGLEGLRFCDIHPTQKFPNPIWYCWI